MKKVEFIGIPSGDGECSCWAVNEETILKFKEQLHIETKEDASLRKSFYEKGMYRLYEEDFYDRDDAKDVTINIRDIDGLRKKVTITQR